MMPSLRSAQVIDCWSGLRPERPLIRLETERLPSGRIWCEQVPYSDHRSFAPSRFLSLSLSLSPPLVFSFALAPSRLPPRALPSRSLSLSLFKPGCGLTACSRGSRPTPHLCTPRATCQHSQLRPWRLRDDAALGLRRQSCRPCQGTGREGEALTSRSTSSGTSVGILLQLGVDPDDASATNTIANNRLHSRSGEISKERARRLSEKCALSRKRKIALRQTSDP